MKQVLFGALCLTMISSLSMAAKKPSPPSEILQTTHDDLCDGAPCVIYRDGAGPYVGGVDSVVIEFGSGGTYKMTIYSSSSRSLFVDLGANVGDTCDRQHLGTLRFLRVDGIANLGPGESMMTTGYSQINGYDGIWNLYWGTNGTDPVRVGRNLDGSWTVNTTGSEQAFVEVPAQRGPKWDPCGLSKASFSFTTEIMGN